MAGTDRQLVCHRAADDRQAVTIATDKRHSSVIPNDGARLAFHARNTPIQLLEDRMIVESVTAGNGEKIIGHLQTVPFGQNGG